MNRVKNPLLQWSLTIALLTGLLSRVLLRPESSLAEMSLGMQTLTALLLSLLPVTGIVFGVLSWRRKEVKVGWSIVVIVLNTVEFLFVFLRLFFLSEG